MAKTKEQSVISSRTVTSSRTYTIKGLVSLILGKVSKLGLSNPMAELFLPPRRDPEISSPH